MRRAVPTTSIAIAFHVVMAVMIFTARTPSHVAAPITKSDDVVEVGSSMMDRVAATESSAEEGATIVPSAGGGAVLVAPRGNVGAAMRAAPHVVEAAPAKEIAIAPAPAEVPTVAIMPPRAVGIGGSNILLPKSSEKKTVEAPALVDRIVTTTIEDAARSTSAANGRAVFVVKAEAKEGDCAVVAVDLVERDGAGWDEARRVALERLRGKKVSVPAGTKLALLSIEVTSGVSLPDDAVVGRRGDNDMPELVLPDISGGAHRVIASRVMKTTYL